MMYIVVINCWISSVCDDRICVYLEKAESPDAAMAQARVRLDYPEQVFDVTAKAVSEANLGLVYMQLG